MSKTGIYREQHDSLLEIAGTLSKQLDPQSLGENAQSARQTLSSLLGKLNVHLSMEDKSLYPQLLSDSDHKIKLTAENFVSEMGDIGKVLTEYKTKWASALPIQENPADFITETEGILSALGDRISRENNELYPLLDNQS